MPDSNSKNIIHITSVHNPFDNRIFFKECISLNKSGYNVTLIAPIDNDTVSNGISIIGYGKINNKYLRVVFSQFYILNKLKNINASIYHFHDPELILLSFIFRLLGKNVVYDMHENLPFQVIHKKWIPRLLRKPISVACGLLERIFLANTNVVFAEDSYIKNHNYIKNYVFVKNFPNTKLLSQIQSEKDKKFTISYIGGVSVERGIENILKALDVINKNNNEVRFLCIGKAFDVNLKTKLSSRKDVEYHDFIPADQAVKILAKAHVGLAVLHNIPNYYESYPTKVFEYMALGMPVILSNFPIYKEIVDNNKCGIAVDPENIDEIVMAINKLKNDEEVFCKMVEECRLSAVKYYNWDEQYNNLAEFYANIISR